MTQVTQKCQMSHTAQKMKFLADLVTFTEEILNGKLFLCSASHFKVRLPTSKKIGLFTSIKAL